VHQTLFGLFGIKLLFLHKLFRWFSFTKNNLYREAGDLFANYIHRHLRDIHSCDRNEEEVLDFGEDYRFHTTGCLL
jgi:hypothetical protein